MKQVSLTLYTFDELTPEVQNKVIDRERFNIMDRQMEISNSSFRKTLAKFEQLFSTSVFNWEVDYCGFTYRYKINEIDAYCFDYVRKDGEEVFGEFPLEELSGKLLRRYINNNIVPCLFTRKFYWNGRSKSRHSRIIRNCVCPLTGDVTDTCILKPFIEFLSSHDFKTTYSQLIDQCIGSMFSAWHEEFQLWADDDNSVRGVLMDDLDTLYYSDGTVYSGPLELAV